MGFQIHTPKIYGFCQPHRTTVLASRDVLPVCRATANLEQRPQKLVENAVKLSNFFLPFLGAVPRMPQNGVAPLKTEESGGD